MMAPPRYPAAHPLWGSSQEIADDSLRFFDRLLARFVEEPVVRVRFGPISDDVVLDPELARAVMTAGHDRLKRPWFLNRAFKEISGLNLFTSEGELWSGKRTLVTPAFHRRHVTSMAAHMTALADDFADRLDDGTTLDLTRAMTELTLRIAGRAMFGVDTTRAGRSRRLMEGFEAMVGWIDRRLAKLTSAPMWLPTRHARRVRAAVRTVDEEVRQIIDDRRHGRVAPGTDLLQLLLDSTTEDGRPLPTETVLAESKAFFFAGHETTASALAYAWYELALNPEIRRALDQELSDGLSGRPATYDDLDRLDLTRRVIEESLRLHPPAVALARVLTRPLEVGGHRIARHRPVLILTYAIHRHPRHWDDPLRFDPDRFLPERSAGRHPHAYLPFGLGPRMCIGSRFAMTEATLVLANLARRWHFDLPADFEVRHDTRFVLKPVTLPVTVSARAGVA